MVREREIVLHAIRAADDGREEVCVWRREQGRREASTAKEESSSDRVEGKGRILASDFASSLAERRQATDTHRGKTERRALTHRRSIKSLLLFLSVSSQTHGDTKIMIRVIVCVSCLTAMIISITRESEALYSLRRSLSLSCLHHRHTATHHDY